MELLLKNLQKNKSGFDKWVLCLNTSEEEDLNYCRQLAGRFDWINVLELEIPHNGSWSIHSFFKHFVAPNAVYLRLDDDIVYLEAGFCEKIFGFREANPNYFLVYGNIVNNAIIDHLHQRFGSLIYSQHVEYNCMGTSWKEGFNFEIENAHRQFINNVKIDQSTNRFKFTPCWILNCFERCSINCISWLGREFAKFQGSVGEDEEQWLSVDKPREIGKPNIIFGEAVCSHFAFHTHREYLDATNLLVEYSSIAEI